MKNEVAMWGLFSHCCTVLVAVAKQPPRGIYDKKTTLILESARMRKHGRSKIKPAIHLLGLKIKGLGA